MIFERWFAYLTKATKTESRKSWKRFWEFVGILGVVMYEQDRHCIYHFGPFSLDAQKRLLLRDGKPVRLFPKELETLLALVAHRGEVLDKDELMRMVWGEVVVEECNLAKNISQLRKLLGEKPNQHEYIVTVPGQGYRFVASVRAAGFDEAIVREHTRVIVEQEEDAEIADRELRIADSSDEKPAALEVVFNPRSRQSAIRGVLISIGLVGVLLVVGWIAFWRDKPPAGKTIPFQNVTLSQITTNSKASLAALSPDGKLFVYASRTGGTESLLLGHVEGGEPVTLRSPANVLYLSLRFSPDGGSIYYVLSGGEYPTGALCKIHALGGVPEELRENIGARVAFAPDMKQFAYVRHDRENRTSDLMITNSQELGERALVSRPEGLPFRSFSPSWSPDGQTIAAGAVSDGSGGYEIFVASAADGQIRPLTASAWHEVLATHWLPDGKGLAVVAKEKDVWDRAQLWIVSYPEGAVHRVLHDLDNYNSGTVSLSSDGQWLLALQAQRMSNVWVAPADRMSQAKQITFGSVGRRDGWGNLDWTPDGRLLYGATIRESLSIWMMDADGDNQEQLTSSGYMDAHLSVPDDGRYIVFDSNRSGQTEIWRARLNGAELKQLTSGGGNGEPHVSPDGKWVVYKCLRDGLGTIWRISIDGGEPVRLAQKPAIWPRISPDGRLIACGYAPYLNSRTQLAILPSEGGPPVKLFEVPRRANFVYGIRWTPDGKAVTYRDSGNGIWRQAIEGGEPKRLVGLPEQKLFSYAWSKDGKQLAFAVEPDLRDLVLIRNVR
jgi:Tol biopolymer transport system component/DNA-binding winged helix-turn-helix (wHTH) protein